MGPDARRGLMGWLAGVAVAATLAGLGIWVAPEVARQVIHTRRGGVGDVAARSPAEVDAFVQASLSLAGASRLVATQEREGTVAATWQLRPDTTAEAATTALRDAARREGFELHAVLRDELDAEVRVYAGSRLRQELLLIPSLPPPDPLPPPVNRRERPLVALVLAGLGAEAAPLVRTAAPLTVAVRPYTPFALATARDAAMAWQEVLVEVDGSTPDVAAARAAVPFATGILARGGTGEAAARASTGGVLVVERAPGSALAPSLLVVQPWRARQRALDDLLARVRALALAHGATAVLLEPDDPATPALLSWATEGHQRGYRLVHASEVARVRDVVGMLDAVNPRASGP